MFVVSQLITAKKKNESAWFTNHSSPFQCLWNVNLSLETWDVIIMKNLYANDSEFYRFLYSTQVTGVACKIYVRLI